MTPPTPRLAWILFLFFTLTQHKAVSSVTGNFQKVCPPLSFADTPREKKVNRWCFPAFLSRSDCAEKQISACRAAVKHSENIGALPGSNNNKAPFPTDVLHNGQGLVWGLSSADAMLVVTRERACPVGAPQLRSSRKAPTWCTLRQRKETEQDRWAFNITL